MLHKKWQLLFFAISLHCNIYFVVSCCYPWAHGFGKFGQRFSKLNQVLHQQGWRCNWRNTGKSWKIKTSGFCWKPRVFTQTLRFSRVWKVKVYIYIYWPYIVATMDRTCSGYPPTIYIYIAGYNWLVDCNSFTSPLIWSFGYVIISQGIPSVDGQTIIRIPSYSH